MNGVTPTAPGDETGQRSLGLTTCTALVIGNMVGSGFFIAPSALARFGTTALIGWAVMAIGAICLGMVFARLARIAPATGGPYAYTRLGFGDFAGFLVATAAPRTVVTAALDAAPDATASLPSRTAVTARR